MTLVCRGLGRRRAAAGPPPSALSDFHVVFQPLVNIDAVVRSAQEQLGLLVSPMVVIANPVVRNLPGFGLTVSKLSSIAPTAVGAAQSEMQIALSQVIDGETIVVNGAMRLTLESMPYIESTQVNSTDEIAVHFELISRIVN